MFDLKPIQSSNKQDLYNQLNTFLEALIRNETDWLANCANFTALLFAMLPDINWVGFYFLKGGELVLGPFQGNPACVRIPLGKGVCGTAAFTREIQLVDDVDLFPGHIACDAASRSELVIPVIQNDCLIGVLDIDSPLLKRFDQTDAQGLSASADLLNRSIRWPDLE